MTQTTLDRPVFAPWKGERYGQESRFGVGVLVIGESHYGSDHNTIGTVQWFRERPQRFFTGAAMVLLGVPIGSQLDSRARAEIWDHVAFYNYFQSFVGDRPRATPEAHQWAEAERPFRWVLNDLQPQVVLVLSKRLRGHLSRTEPMLAKLEVCWARHPSGRGWSLDTKQEIIRDFRGAIQRASTP